MNIKMSTLGLFTSCMLFATTSSLASKSKDLYIKQLKRQHLYACVQDSKHQEKQKRRIAHVLARMGIKIETSTPSPMKQLSPRSTATHGKNWATLDTCNLNEADIAMISKNLWVYDPITQTSSRAPMQQIPTSLLATSEHPHHLSNMNAALPAKKPTTILIYMAADNNLAPEARMLDEIDQTKKPHTITRAFAHMDLNAHSTMPFAPYESPITHSTRLKTPTPIQQSPRNTTPFQDSKNFNVAPSITLSAAPIPASWNPFNGLTPTVLSEKNSTQSYSPDAQ